MKDRLTEHIYFEYLYKTVTVNSQQLQQRDQMTRQAAIQNRIDVSPKEQSGETTFSFKKLFQ